MEPRTDPALSRYPRSKRAVDVDAHSFIYLSAWNTEAMALLKTDKIFGERKSEQPRSHAFLPMNKCKMQKIESPVQQSQKATPSSTMAFPGTVALLRPQGPRGRVPLS
jgi:hypothetical protein